MFRQLSGCAWTVVTVALVGFAPPTVGTAVNISNAAPRHNVTGNIMDAHDGSYNQWTPGGPWYYYAMGYGTCKQGGDMCHGCGYGYSWIGVWTSKDMSNGSWTLLRDARDDTWPKVTYFRVHVVFNAKTKLYVLWVNLNGGGGGDYAIGTSATPEGPFTFVHAVDAGRRSGGDFDILVDDDGAGYIIYTATGSGHTMAIERLTDDYLASAATPLPPPPPPPLPPISGYTVVGDGACRDATGKEPAFVTNEPNHKAGFTEQDCIQACNATSDCQDVSYCATNPGCSGACHLYTTAPSKGPQGTWNWVTPGGNLPVTKVTDETWWHCYAKTTSASETAALSTSLRRSTASPSNVSSGVFGNTFVEAPVLFKRKGIYYALFDNCCCFCGHGSGIGVYTATDPLGPYTYHNNVGCRANVSLTPGCGCGMDHAIDHASCDFYGDSLTLAQQNFVIRIPQPDGTMQYVWTGDRWQSAADGIKAHDLQYWSVLDWVAGPNGIDLPLQFVWQDTIVINV